MAASRIVFICEEHLSASGVEALCPVCKRPMLRCDAGLPGSERSRPLFDEQGQIRSRAPRWWLERHVEQSGVDS
jgi:hypothetical protein